MENRYNRNRIYVSEQEQNTIRNARVLLGGAGIGSIIAECAVRFGFESITIVDGDKVEETNLNRQNYCQSDIGKFKVDVLAKRLKKINPKVQIKIINDFIDNDNVYEIIEGHDIAINALDFKSDIPFLFDKICQQKGIFVLHPYNFGWGGFLTIIAPDKFSLTELSEKYENFELEVVNHVVKYGKFWGVPVTWLEDIVSIYRKESDLPPPQLSIGSWIAAGYCVNAMYNILTNKNILCFPKFYFSSILNGGY